MSDEFLKEIANHQSSYQSLFNQMVNNIDDAVYARWLSGASELNKGEFEREGEKAETFFVKARGEGLSEVALWVAYLQYTKADIFDREKWKNHWMDRIQKRSKVDFFPDHNGIIHILNKLGYLE